MPGTRSWLWLLLMAMVFGPLSCQQEETRCAICYMPIPEQTRAVIRVEGGPPRHVCDARCPLTYQQETGHKVELIQVTDYGTHAPLDPAHAWYVTGSDVAPDAHTEALRTTPADTAYLHWHRCLPSVLAFSKRQAAQLFQREHGGTLMTLADLGFAAGQEKQP